MKVAFLFSGQGSQVVGMGKDFYEQYESAKVMFDTYGSNDTLKKLCFEGPQSLLNETQNAQPCSVLTSLAIASVLQEYGIQASMVAGLSLGEYSALCYAKVFSIQDTMKLVSKRGEIMQKALASCDSTMYAVLGLEAYVVEEVCKLVPGICEIANYNCPGQIVITGETKSLELAKPILIEKGARRVLPLKVSGAFHSSLLKEASEQFKQEVESYKVCNPQVPVVYNCYGTPSQEKVSNILAKQMHQSVYFEQSIVYMLDQGTTHFIEIGPGTSIQGFVKRIHKECKVYSIHSVEALKQILQEIQHEQ